MEAVVFIKCGFKIIENDHNHVNLLNDFIFTLHFRNQKWWWWCCQQRMLQITFSPWLWMNSLHTNLDFMNKYWGISYQDLWHMSVWSGKLLSCLSTWKIPTEIKYVSRKQWWCVFLFPTFPLLFLQDNIMLPESLWMLSQDEHQLIFYKKGNFYFPCFFLAHARAATITSTILIDLFSEISPKCVPQDEDMKMEHLLLWI